RGLFSLAPCLARAVRRAACCRLRSLDEVRYPLPVDIIAFAGEQRRSFSERKADDVRVGADEPLNERAGEALDRITAGLAAPFAALEISLELAAGQALEPEARLDQAAPRRAARGDKRKAGVDAMGAAGEELEACLRFVSRFAFRQDPPADADDRIGPQRETGRKISPLQRDSRRSERLLHGQPLSERVWRFAAARGFVNLRRQDRLGADADLGQEGEPARRTGG